MRPKVIYYSGIWALRVRLHRVSAGLGLRLWGVGFRSRGTRRLRFLMGGPHGALTVNTLRRTPEFKQPVRKWFRATARYTPLLSVQSILIQPLYFRSLNNAQYSSQNKNCNRSRNPGLIVETPVLYRKGLPAWALHVGVFVLAVAETEDCLGFRVQGLGYHLDPPTSPDHTLYLGL